MPRVVLIFVEEGQFRNGGPILQRRGIFAAAKWGGVCCEMAIVCQRGVSQLWNTLQNGALAAKSGSFYALEISQLRNGGTVLRNGTRVPRGGFATAKIFTEGGMGLRNHFAAKWHFRSDFLGLRNNFAAKWRFRKGLFWLQNNFTAKGHFRRGLLWLWNLAGHEFFLAFELLFSSKRPSFIFFAIPPTLDHSKRLSYI